MMTYFLDKGEIHDHIWSYMIKGMLMGEIHDHQRNAKGGNP